MHSFKTSALVAAAAFLVFVQAQYEIDPTVVPIAQRQAWCQSQITACPLLCLQLPGESATTEANDCEATNLVYNCVCGNGQSPNASEYSQTIPYFKCTEFGNQCVAACAGNSDCQSACRTDNLCGAQNPTRANTTSSSSSSSATASSTDGVVYNGLGGDGDSNASNDAGSQATALNIGRSYGLAVVLAGLFAGFALVI